MSDRNEPVREVKSSVISSKTEGGQSTSQFQDKRPEASNLTQLQEVANGSAQVEQLSAIQQDANNHSQDVLQNQKMSSGLSDNLKGYISMVRHNNLRIEPAAGVPIQLLMDQAAYEHAREAEEVQNVRLATIGGILDTYHALNDENDENYQVRLRTLKNLDTQIYQWFDTFVTSKITDTTNGTFMQGLLKESEDEHRVLIAAISGNEALAPIDTSTLGMGEDVAVQTLWRSLVAGDGNIRILEKTPGYRNRILADLAKLLQGPKGRLLLTQLNAGGESAAHRITISSNFTNELADVSKAEAPGDEAIPLSSLPDESENYELKPVSNAEVGGISLDDIATYDGPVGNMEALNLFLKTNERTHVKYNNVVYSKGTSTGSLVRILPKDPGQLIGEETQEVIAPEFVTLGHELGHAQRFLTGNTLGSSTNLDTFGIEPNTPASNLWHNSEEYVNIKGVENPLREEHGISKRKFHSGDVDDVKEQINHKRVDDAIFAIYNELPVWGRTVINENHLFLALRTEINAPTINFSDDVAVATLMLKVAELDLIKTQLIALAQNAKNPDILYKKSKGILQRKLDKDTDFQLYYRMFKRKIASSSNDVLLRDLVRIVDLSYERYLSMELSAAKSREFLLESED